VGSPAGPVRDQAEIEFDTIILSERKENWEGLAHYFRLYGLDFMAL